MNPICWAEGLVEGLAEGEKMPEMLLPQKPWGREALEMREGLSRC